MATVDKKITDLATVTQLSDDDLLLLEGQNETYNVAFRTLKNNAKADMVSNNWGSENAGKTLMVGANGHVILGEGEAVLMSRASWDDLTAEAKKAYGLVAIQETMTGYLRGTLVNGADYTSGIYLPYSDGSTIICEAYPDIYDEEETQWGIGTNPIQLSALRLVQNDDGSVTIPTKTAGVLAYVDLGRSGTNFTAYIVGKIRNANSSYTRLLSCVAARSQGQGIMLYGSPVKVSSWASDTATNVNANTYFAGAIQFGSGGGAGSASGYVTASSSTLTMISKSPTTAGRYITIGRTDIDPSTQNAEPTDMDVLYLGVTSIAESQSIVTLNVLDLADRFIS